MNSSTTDATKDLLLPVAVSQKDEKPLTAGLDDTQYRTLKSKLPKHRLKKSSIPQYHKPPCPSRSVSQR